MIKNLLIGGGLIWAAWRLVSSGAPQTLRQNTQPAPGRANGPDRSQATGRAAPRAKTQPRAARAPRSIPQELRCASIADRWEEEGSAGMVSSGALI